jgi:hypothetical protein
MMGVVASAEAASVFGMMMMVMIIIKGLSCMSLIVSVSDLFYSCPIFLECNRKYSDLSCFLVELKLTVVWF